MMHTDILTSTIAITCMSMAVLCGCDETSTRDAAKGDAAISAETRTREFDSEEAPAPEFTDLVVREFLHEWLEARNNRQFEAYASLYTTRFDGIDRSGLVPVRFEREQWLNNAEHRFTQSTTTKWEDSSIRIVPGGANVSLIETEVADDDAVRIQRHLLLVAEDGRLKIASEQILPVEAAPDTGVKNPEHKVLNDFFLILDNRYVVFDIADMEKDGALYVNETTALKPARKEHFSKSLRRLLKRRFVVGYEDGTTAVMGITDTRAIAKYAVHGAVESFWKTIGLSEVEMGELLWELAAHSGSTYMVGILKHTRKGALWAHALQPRTPEVYLTQTLDTTSLQNIRKRLRKRPASKQIQDQFESASREGNWMSYEPLMAAKLFRSPRRNRRFAAVSISAGKGCGDFYGFTQGFFHMHEGTLWDMGYPAHFFQDAFIDNRDALQAIDIDHDGVPEFVGRNKLMYKIDDEWFVYELKIPLSDCPC